MPLSAVITGDLIHSRTVRDTGAYLKRLRAILRELGQRHGAETDTFRGDGFQLLLADATPVFECAVALRAALIGASQPGERWDARLALGIGAANPTGPGFSDAAVLSGQGLDGMQRETLRVFSRDESLLRYADLPTAFLETLIDNWTPVEAQTYHLHLTQGLDQRGIATALGKSRVTITKALQRANARLVDRYLGCARQWLTEIDR